MSSGFDSRELVNFYENLEKLSNDFPEAQKAVLKEQAAGLLKKTKSIARKEVRKGAEKSFVDKKGVKRYKNYHKRWKKGKFYYYHDQPSVRVYNSAPHAHLIEYGHKNVDGSFTPGKYVSKKAYDLFEGEFEDNLEKFVDIFLNKGVG